MQANGTFRIESWDANSRAVDVETGTPLDGAFIVRALEGPDIVGRSQVLFVGAFNEELGSGSYAAIDAFEGEILGRRGTLNFWHASTMRRGAFVAEDALLRIVPDSGTGQLAGAHGSGRFHTEDGVERIELDIEFGDDDDIVDGEAAAGKLEP